MPQLDADAVLALAQAHGQQWIDRETAGRIATGAAAAMRPVFELETALEAQTISAAGQGDLAAFLDELARLAKGNR